MNRSRFANLASLVDENPAKTMRLLRLIWPEIRNALSAGHTVKMIHSRLVQDGMAISYGVLRCYVSRLRREPPSPSLAASPKRSVSIVSEDRPSPTSPRPTDSPVDRMANVRERLDRNRQGFHRNGGVPDRKKLYEEE
jgi:hypothetical protein